MMRKQKKQRSQTASIIDVLYEAPGPRARRKIQVFTIISLAALLILLLLIIRQFYVNGQLDQKYWSIFLRKTTWAFLGEGLLGTVKAALGASVVSFGIAMLLMLLILLVALAFLRPKLGGSVKSEVKVEAGDFSLTPEMFLRDGEEAEIDFSDGFDPSSVEKNAVGRYKVGLVVGGKNESATLIVEDTTPPSAEANPRAVDLGSDIEPEALIKNASDNTGITSVTFKKTPDLTKNGTFDVDIVLADASGNKATVTSSLTVVPVHAEITKNVGDEPPTISDFLLNGGSSEGAALRFYTRSGARGGLP